MAEAPTAAVQCEPSLVGLVGHPVAGNPTGAMFEAAFADVGLDWRYVSMDVRGEALGPAVAGLAALGFRGFHVTVPHKVAVVDHMAALSPAAAAIGAVNCAIPDGAGGWLGENTDGKGFLTALQRVMPAGRLRACVLGAGGAARAAAVELALAGAADVTVVNRDPDRGRALVRALSDRTRAAARWVAWEEPIRIPAGTDVLVQATSLGLNDAGAGPRIDWSTAPASLLVTDVVMSPPRTRLLVEAAAAGYRTLDGRGMLVNQALAAFRLWTGLDADWAVMHAVLAGP